MDVAVIICAYTLDRWDLLGRAVESVGSQATEHELILVIDHNDDLLEQARLAWPQARVIANAGERGLSDARNTGVRATEAEVIAFLDDDACAAADWLAHLVGPFDDTRVGLTGGRVLPDWALGRPAWLPEEFFWVVGCSYVGLPATPAPIRNPIGASMAVRRKVFAEVGLFHNGVGRVGTNTAGCEETELGIRARRAGWTARYAPSSLVHHFVPPDRHGFRYFTRRCWSEGRAKAIVATLAGAEQALESERAYVSRTLPAGIVAHIAGRRPTRLRGALAIAAGFGITALGYARGRVRRPTLGALPPAPRLDPATSSGRELPEVTIRV